MAAGRGDCGDGWAGVGGTGRGVSAGGRFVCISARDLRPEGRGKLAELSVCVAAEFFSAAFDCVGVHRAVEFSGVVLAGAGDGSDCGAACAALCEFCGGGGVFAGDGAAVSESEFGDAAGVGAVCGRDGGDGGRDCVGVCACGGDGRMAHAGFAGAVGGGGDWRAGAGDADCDVRLLGLLQHHVSGQRSEGSRRRRFRGRFCCRCCL